ncbi:MAG: hypothetical protein OEM81_02480, partial [Acidimicrobiia bacterium]|nr:hypothetical protein [Acidimicrobiia bacterium]
MADRKHLEERREIAARDLTELAEQVEAGEIDQATAEALRANYQAEVDDVAAQLAALARLDQQRSSEPKAETPG